MPGLRCCCLVAVFLATSDDVFAHTELALNTTQIELLTTNGTISLPTSAPASAAPSPSLSTPTPTNSSTNAPSVRPSASPAPSPSAQSNTTTSTNRSDSHGSASNSVDAQIVDEAEAGTSLPEPTDTPSASPALQTEPSSPSPAPTEALTAPPGKTRTYVRRTAAPPSSPGEEAGTIGDPTRIVGGRLDRDSDNHDASSGTSSASSSIYRGVQYAMSVAAAISVLLLLSSYVFAVDERFDWSQTPCAPNTWEFILFTSYIQHILSLGQLVLTKTPQPLWQVVDSFSWSSFLPYHTKESGIERRLDTILLSGIVAFADRVGVKEVDLLIRTVTGLAVFAGALLLLFFIVAVFTKMKMDRHHDYPSRRTPLDVSRILFWRDIGMRVCGLLVLLWFFALSPLSTMASYEMSMEVRSDSVSAAPLAVAVIALLVVCLGGLLFVGYTISTKRRHDARQPFLVMAFGSLYADYTYDARYFLVVPVLFQIANGLIVGAATSDVTQLVLLLVTHAVYLAMFLLIKPFARGCVAPWFLIAVGLVRIANVATCFVFTSSSVWRPSTVASAADAIVWLNAMLLFSWLLRHVGTAVQIVAALRRGPPVVPSPTARTLATQEDTREGSFAIMESTRWMVSQPWSSADHKSRRMDH